MTKITDTPLALYITIAASVGAAYWVGRLLTKQYMAQRHLIEDAEERSTLIQTYISMINEAGIKPEQADTVLKSIFRPSTDGLIAGDSAPQLPFEIVQKSFAERR